MDYRKELAKIIENSSDEKMIEMIYYFVRRFVKNWEP